MLKKFIAGDWELHGETWEEHARAHSPMTAEQRTVMLAAAREIPKGEDWPMIRGDQTPEQNAVFCAYSDAQCARERAVLALVGQVRSPAAEADPSDRVAFARAWKATVDLVESMIDFAVRRARPGTDAAIYRAMLRERCAAPGCPLPDWVPFCEWAMWGGDDVHWFRREYDWRVRTAPKLAA